MTTGESIATMRVAQAKVIRAKQHGYTLGRFLYWFVPAAQWAFAEQLWHPLTWDDVRSVNPDDRRRFFK